MPWTACRAFVAACGYLISRRKGVHPSGPRRRDRDGGTVLCRPYGVARMRCRQLGAAASLHRTDDASQSFVSKRIMHHDNVRIHRLAVGGCRFAGARRPARGGAGRCSRPSRRRRRQQTYIPVVPTKTFDETFSSKTRPTRPRCMSDQKALLEKRYDLGNNPSNVQMSGKRKAVQQGVRVKLHGGATLGHRSAACRRSRSSSRTCSRMGFRPLPHVKHPTGGMVFPKQQIDEIKKAGSPRPAAVRRRLRSAGPPHARVSAADVPHQPARLGRRVATARC